MGRKTTKPIQEQRSALTKRQEVDVRTQLMSKTSKIMNRIVRVAEGERDEDGNLVEEMTPMEFKAAELLLRKTLPDLSAVAHVNTDELADLDRNELVSMLGAVLESQPHLAAVPAIREVVNQSQSVNDIQGKATIVESPDEAS